MQGFAKSLVVDGRKVRLVMFPTVAKVRTSDYREIGHIYQAQAGGFDCVRCSKVVAHADDPRAAVEALVKAYNAERRELASASGAA